MLHHRLNPSKLDYCLEDGPSEVCVGKDGRYYKVVRRSPRVLVLRRVTLAEAFPYH